MKKNSKLSQTIKCILSIYIMSVSTVICCGIRGHAELIDIIDYLYTYSVLAVGTIGLTIILGRVNMPKKKIISYVDKAINLLQIYKLDGCKDKDLLDRATWCIEQEQKKAR